MTVPNAHAKAWNSQGRLVVGYIPGPVLPTDDDSECLRSSVESTFLDTCQIGTSTLSNSTYETETIVYGAVIACRFSVQRARESVGAQSDLNACMLRISLDQIAAVASTSHVKLIARYGTTLPTADVFRVIGGPQIGQAAITLNLERLPSGGVG